MNSPYDDVICRFLCRAERRVSTDQESTPLVIEPLKSSSSTFLREFLERNSQSIIRDIAKYGALLLRGFEIDSSSSFEKAILSIHGMRGMRDILFQLPGRLQPVPGSQFVYPTSITSRGEKTGGTLKFELFHSENYGFPDVPSYVGFFCGKPCWLGGETGMINVAHLYSNLPQGLKQRLESSACLVQLHSIPAAARKYKLTEQELRDFASKTKLPVVQLGEVPYVAIYKSSVLEHPITRERTLTVNFNWIPTLQREVIDTFLNNYGGVRWTIHRSLWRSPWLGCIARTLRGSGETPDDHVYVIGDSPVTHTTSLSSLFSAEDVRSIALIMRRSYSDFVWRKGDVLLLDNLKIAHSGMPGMGSRQLQIMMCNPLRLPTESSTDGYQKVLDEHQALECVGALLARFRTNYDSGEARVA